MTLPTGQIASWDAWKRADAAMVAMVKAALEVKQSAKTAADRAAARKAYDALLQEWARLKSIGLKVVDADIASAGLVEDIKEQTDKLIEEADRIAALAQTVNTIASFVAEVANAIRQVQEVVVSLGKLTL